MQITTNRSKTMNNPNSEGIFGFRLLEDNDTNRQLDENEQLTKSGSSLPPELAGEAVLRELIRARAGQLNSQTSGKQYQGVLELVDKFLTGTDQNRSESDQPKFNYTEPEPRTGIPTLEEVLLEAKANGSQVVVNENFQPNAAGEARKKPTTVSKAKLQKDKTINKLKKHRNFTAVGIGMVLVASGIAANNQVEGGLLARVPVIGKYFEKPLPPTAQELSILAQELARSTSIEKPLVKEPLAISEIQAPANEPEISVPINYSVTNEAGEELTIANAVRLAAKGPNLQINYGYNLDSLKSNLVYNAETQTVSIPAEALRLQLLLLAPTAENGAVSTVSPEFVYRVAGSVGDNEAIKVILEKQHKDFSSKDIRIFMHELANPQNEAFLSQKIISGAINGLLADDQFLEAVTDQVNIQVAADVAKINPELKLDKIVLGPELLQDIQANASKAASSQTLTDGLSTSGVIDGLKIPTEIK